MKNLKPILITIFCGLIVFGLVSAATYRDVSPQRTEMQIIDDKEIEVEIDTPDKEKTIKKEWQETISNEFTIEDKEQELTNILGNIEDDINRYNLIIDEFTEAKTSLKLNIEISGKIMICDKTLIK